MSISLKQQTFIGIIWSTIERFSVQGVQFVLSIIIARQLLPSDYGLIAMLTIFMSIAQSFVDSGFSNALIQKQNRTEDDLSTVFYFNIVIGIIMYLILILCSTEIAIFYNQPILKKIIIWIGLNLIINSLSTIQNAILTIAVNFKKQTYISLIAVISSGIIAIYMAINGYGVWTLVVQSILNNLIKTSLLWISTTWYPKLIFSVSSFKELFSFGSKLLIGGLLHTIYINLYTLVIGKFFSVKELGLYSKASTLTQYPSINITGITSRVLYPILCRFQNDDKELTYKFYLSIRLISYIVFPMMIGLAILSEPLIILILTEKWIEVVPYMQILCLAYMWEPIMHITWSLLNVKHRSDFSLKSEIIKKIIAVTILFATIPLGIKTMCIGLIIYSLFDITIISKFTCKILPEITTKNIFKNTTSILLQSIIMGVIVYLFTQLITNLWIQLFGGIIIGFITYILLSFYLCKKEFNYIILLLKRTKQ